jgi:hypothetical protein
MSSMAINLNQSWNQDQTAEVIYAEQSLKAPTPVATETKAVKPQSTGPIQKPDW